MKLDEVQSRINYLMAIFVAQIKGATAMNRSDINKVAETVLVQLFSEVYGYKDLKNLNFSQHSNFPSIDLGDKIKKVAIQVTATPSNEKIKETLRKFVEYDLYHQFDKL